MYYYSELLREVVLLIRTWLRHALSGFFPLNQFPEGRMSAS